ncbi:CobW family GTP-binding protein [Streptomyces caatingaensis]|uniref:CobW family GTP-binding protein n=1 Tax=Streptomyces caatingaensis TaxID=1678637 RepID=UPI00099DB200|nr:GTP-binding protein [Streptomyces caatingaensis]
MTKRQIPVIVLAGFLGSGKTTLLNHLLTHSGGSRIGVVVNDFGSIEIDAMSVAGQVGSSMVSLGNGCLCCAVDTSDLDAFLDRLSRPAARIDVIVIEASGLAEPQELVRMILASDNTEIMYGGLVEVVDAAEFGRTRVRHPELDRHLGVADLVVLNKTDRIGEAEREELAGVLAELAPGTPVVAASYGRVDPELLFDRRPREERLEGIRQLSFEDLVRDGHEHGCGHDSGHGCGHGCGHDQGHEGHLHAAYESVEFVSEEPLHPRRFMEFLDRRPEGLYRIKGFVYFGVPGHRQKFALHAVGDFLRMHRSAWGRSEARVTQLVMIGSGIDGGALREGLEGCRWGGGGVSGAGGAGDGGDGGGVDVDVDERSMWGVLRYTQG